MIMRIRKSLLLVISTKCLIAVGNSSNWQSASVITVKANEVKATFNRQWGIFFEDKNVGADGDLCGELVKNGLLSFLLH